MRRLLLQSTYNTRDLGGFPTLEGRVTRYAKVFRSDCPDVLSEGDVTLLKQRDVRTVIDLRVEEELLKRPSGFAKLSGVTYHHCPFKLGDQAPETEEGVSALYFAMLEDFENMKRVTELIARSEGAVILHCAAGKDRTGIVAAALLGMCGVLDSDILADYEVSYTYLRDLIKILRGSHPDWPEWRGHSKMDYMDGALRLLLNRYGSFENYVKAAGIDEDTYMGVKRRLLEGV